MKKFIRHLQQKPDHVKTRYVIVFSVAATVLVVGVWILLLQVTQVKDDTIKTESPFALFGDIFSGAITDVKSNYQENKQGLNGTLQQISETPETESLGDQATYTDTAGALDASLSNTEIPVPESQ